MYKLLYTKWAEACTLCEKQKGMIISLTQRKGKFQGCVLCEEQKGIIFSLSQEKERLQGENCMNKFGSSCTSLGFDDNKYFIE